jgi:hypothetical protein
MQDDQSTQGWLLGLSHQFDLFLKETTEFLKGVIHCVHRGEKVLILIEAAIIHVELR